MLSSAEQKDMHVFLLIGQSNMAGRAKLKAGDDKILKDCQLWNGKSWEDAKAPFNRYSTHRKKNFTTPSKNSRQTTRSSITPSPVSPVAW